MSRPKKVNKPLMSSRILFWGILSVSMLCNSCKSFVEKKRHNLIVLLDYSASGNDLVLDHYISIINETIFANMSQYDCLTVVPIDEGSKMQPVKLIYKDLADTTFKKPTDGFAHAGDSLSLRFKEYVKTYQPQIAAELKEQRIKRANYTEYTDLLGAVQQTSNLIEFNSQGGKLKDVEDFVLGHVSLKSENIIVILSDMIQDSKEYSFNSSKGFTDKQTEDCLADLIKASKIPDLKDCNVFIIGATGKKSTQIDNINSFWTKYFKKTNGDLKAYGYTVEDKLRKYLKTSVD